jgi:glycosyltransferase involved in cell wall biosynthesis
VCAQVIVSDNNSTDGTSSLLGSFGDPRLMVIRQVETLSMSDNFSAGFEHVDAPYAILLGDDDRLGPEFLSVALNRLEADRGAAAFHSAYATIDLHGNILEPYKRRGNQPADRECMDGLEFIVQTINHGLMIHTSSMVFRTDLAPRPVMHTLDGSDDDIGLGLRLAARGRMLYSDEPLARVMHHPGRDGHREWRTLQDVAKRFEHIDNIRGVLSRFAEELRDDIKKQHDWRSMIERRYRLGLLGIIKESTMIGRDPRMVAYAAALATRRRPRIALDLMFRLVRR